MKNSIIALAVVCGSIAGGVIYFGKAKSPPTLPAPVVESAPSQSVPPPENKATNPTGLLATSQPAKIAPANPVAAEVQPDTSATPVQKMVNGLLAAKSGAEKHELFQQLVKAGQIDAAIAELKQRAANNPNDAALPTTLGEAQLNKLRALREAGTGDYNESGILAMQADQSFNAALKIDPQNWEANFVKASSMYYWPANDERDNDVVQRLSGLIDQQEKAAAQSPEYVQTYITLGNQYVKINQPEKALATWQLGLQKFPNDPALQKKISGQ